MRFNCPRCEHRDYRLYVNPERVRTDFWTGARKQGWFLCFECHWRGPLSFLLDQLGIQVDEAVPGSFELRERLLSKETLDVPDRPLRFADAVPALVNDDARSYLLGERGLTVRKVMDAGVFVRFDEGYRRLYFPEFDLDGNIMYCVSRRYLEGDPWPKYMSAGSRQQRGVYRLTEATPGAEITIVEGPLDALAIWDNVGALYGTFMSRRQLEMLSRASDRFLIALDGEARSFAGEIGGRLHALGKQVRVALLPPGEDPSSLGDRWPQYRDEAVPLSEAELLRLRI